MLYIGACLVTVVAACGSNAEDISAEQLMVNMSSESAVTAGNKEADSTESTAASGSEELVSTEASATNSAEVKPGNKTETSEGASAEAAGDTLVEADEILSLIEDIAVKYPDFDKNQLIAAIVISNMDHYNADTYDKVKEAYKLTDEELSDQFTFFSKTYFGAILETAGFLRDEKGKDGEAYNKLPKFVEFAITDEDKAIAMDYDANAFAANATPSMGSHGAGDVSMYDQFDGFTTFEVACKFVQYVVVEGGRLPDQFNLNSFITDFWNK